MTSSAELGKDKGWVIVAPKYSLEKGMLKGTQMRFDTPTKDSVIAFRFKLGSAQPDA